MIANLKKKLFLTTHSKVIIVEITDLNDDDNTVYNIKGLKLQYTSKQITITDKFQGDSIQFFSDWVTSDSHKSTPILLIIDGDKTLNKIIEENSSDSTIILNQIIPKGSVDDFVVQKHNFEQNIFVSICRNSYLEEIISKFFFIDSRLINLSIGPFALFENYKSIGWKTENGNYNISTSYFHFSFSENSLIGYDTVKNEAYNNLSIHFGTEKISSDYSLTLSEGISFLLDPLSINQVNYPKIKKQKDELVFNIYSKFLAIAFSGVLFLILVTSTVLYTVYSDKYNHELELNNANLAALSSIKANNENKIRQDEVTQNYGIANGGRVAYFADQITRTIPEDIYLNRLDIFPIKHNGIDIDEVIDNNKIVINGNCYSSSAVVEWANKLRRYDWVNNAIISRYQQENIDKLGSFSIEIIKTEN